MYLVLGAGRMAEGIVYDLLKTGQSIYVWEKSIDTLHKFLKKFEHSHQIYATHKDLSIPEDSYIPDDVLVIISTLPYDYNVRWAKMAIEDGSDFIDLGGNNDVVAQQHELHEDARANACVIVPDCGLAPGVVSILAMDLLCQVDAFLDRPEKYSIGMSVGGLPLVRNNPLEYQIVFSPHGLINEYVEPATILRNGDIVQVPSLTEVAPTSMPWGFDNLEEFITSGGASTLPVSLQGVCKNVLYKTIRYKGHAAKMQMLLDLFGGQREAFEELLAKACPLTGPDVILLDVTLYEDYSPIEWTPVASHRIIEFGSPESLSAMAKMTAFPAAIIAQALSKNVINNCGVLKQEELFENPSYMVEELKKRGINFI